MFGPSGPVAPQAPVAPVASCCGYGMALHGGFSQHSAAPGSPHRRLHVPGPVTPTAPVGPAAAASAVPLTGGTSGVRPALRDLHPRRALFFPLFDFDRAQCFLATTPFA